MPKYPNRELTAPGCCFWRGFASAFSKADSVLKLDILEVTTFSGSLLLFYTLKGKGDES